MKSPHREHIGQLHRQQREIARTPKPINIRHVLYLMEPSKERRSLILDWLSRDGNMFPVNRRYCLQVHQDRDLQYLLKKGQIVLVRMAHTRRTSYTCVRLA